MNEDVRLQLAEAAAREPYARLLELDVASVDDGGAIVRLIVSKLHCNLFGTAHGGVIFSLMDEAFELACNSHGTLAVALNCNVSFLYPAFAGDTLMAVAREVSCSRKVGTYDIRVTNQDQRLIATCNAMAYRKGDPLPLDDDA